MVRIYYVILITKIIFKIVGLIFSFFRYSCAPVALFSAPVTKYVGESYLPIKVRD